VHTPRDELHRAIGLPGAVLMGLGSIVGTGVFVSLGLAAGIAGPSMLVALVVAAIVAALNGLSSAQLAAAHPVSGGTYEYGHRFLNAPLGFTAGWMFLCAKSASAATAALGFAGYAIELAGGDARHDALRIGLAVAGAVLVTALCVVGIRRTNAMNALIVSITLGTLIAFVLGGLPTALRESDTHLANVWALGEPRDFLHATALLFVAYTGYGRIATLGEEVREPARTIPRAVIATMIVVLVLYAAVAAVAVAAVGAERFHAATTERAAPLEVVARAFGGDLLARVLAVGAVTAMLGVLLNLVLGLSRVWLAMGRRGDMPAALARVAPSTKVPIVAVIVTGTTIVLLALIGHVRTTWSFSAFTVLVYYAITNLAALRLPPALRRYPRVVPALGLVGCLGLAFWVEPTIWIIGLALLAFGLVWHLVAQRMGRSKSVEKTD
jgi:APA family basic amino acid/polyamine antiporter